MDPDRDPGGKKLTKKIEKSLRNKAWGQKNLHFCEKKNIELFSAIYFF
jgi:hypothetical protein